MKHAYISLVLPVTTMPEARTIEALDAALAAESRAHEIVIVAPHGAPVSLTGLGSELRIQGPVSVVATHLRSTPDGSVVAGLARAVGDFIIEWRGPLESVDSQLVGELLEPTDAGIELVEIVGRERSRASRAFNRLVNALRPRTTPLRKTIGRVYSRYAVQTVLGAVAFEPQLDVLAAELPVRRSVHASTLMSPPHAPFSQRLNAGFTLLAKGTRFGSVVPLMLAVVSALTAVGAAVYALAFLVVRGRTPEGWTTLMVLIGLGQAAILTMLGLTWTRIDALTKGLARNPDVTAMVHVAAPTQTGKPDGGSVVVR